MMTIIKLGYLNKILPIPIASTYLLQVIYKLKFPNGNIQVLKCMIDTGSSKSHLDISLVPPECRSRLTIPQSALAMTNEKMVCTECLRDSQISFLTPYNNEEWHRLPQTYLSPVNHQFKFCLGLNFIRSRGLLLIGHFLSFFNRVSTTPTDFLLSHQMT